METPSLLVTGASGFIGRHVMQQLAARDIASVALVRTPPAKPLPGKVTLLVQDMAEPLPPLSVTHCLHLAWGGLPNYKSPTHLETELPKQQAFLSALLARGLRKLVVAGSCLEYGLQSGALDETLPLKPVLPYAEAKVRLLHWLEAQQKNHTLDLCWARLFYTCGEGQNPASLYPQLAAAVARGDKTFPMSGGAQRRDYLPVETVANTLIDLTLKPGNPGAVNVCSGQPVSVQALVEGWLAEHGWRIALALGAYPYPDYEPMEFWGDASKLKQITGR